jgi:hypothetical protein
MYWIQCFDFLILEYKVQNSCNDLSPVFIRVPIAEFVFSRFLIVLSVLLQFTASDYSYGIFNLFADEHMVHMSDGICK